MNNQIYHLIIFVVSVLAVVGLVVTNHMQIDSTLLNTLLLGGASGAGTNSLIKFISGGSDGGAQNVTTK
jgi:hypothetical protein